MPRIKRGGRELVVSESVVREYLRDGYSLIDDQGNIIQPNAPMNYAQAMSEISTLKEREAQLETALSETNEALHAVKKHAEALEAENDALKAELDSMKDHTHDPSAAQSAYSPVEEAKPNEPTIFPTEKTDAPKSEMKRQNRKRAEA